MTSKITWALVPLVTLHCIVGMTCSAQDSDLHAVADLKFLFASEKLGREKLGTRDAYTDQMTGFDRKVRMRKGDAPGVQAFLRFAPDQVRPWPDKERDEVITALRAL